MVGSASGVDLTPAGTGVDTAVAGDQAAKDQALSAEQVAILNAYIAEFSPRAQRSPWDSFVDGVNRLVRAGLAIGAQGAFVWARVDPVGFVETMRVLAIVPDPLWVIWGGILAFYLRPRRRAAAEEVEGRAQAVEIARKSPPNAPPGARRRRRRGKRNGPGLRRRRCRLPSSTWRLSLPPLRSSSPDDVYAGLVDNATDPVRAMSATIWGEARGEPFEGRVAVAWVIINRSRMPGWSGEDIRFSVCSARWQFSCWFDAQAERVRFVDERNEKLAACLDVAKRVMAGEIADPTGGADHYYADYIAAPEVGARPHPDRQDRPTPVLPLGPRQVMHADVVQSSSLTVSPCRAAPAGARSDRRGCRGRSGLLQRRVDRGRDDFGDERVRPNVEQCRSIGAEEVGVIPRADGSMLAGPRIRAGDFIPRMASGSLGAERRSDLPPAHHHRQRS